MRVLPKPLVTKGLLDLLACQFEELSCLEKMTARKVDEIWDLTNDVGFLVLAKAFIARFLAF